ncbi:flagellar basal body rod C-terminal domain-containing protein [Bacillus sp. JCM 19034]|uniref:flagellar basal body rod C-terminal domain-containing protein n=1 Tax=Bacillus sp. JCM 19034 TaxID=1481928 RepID=UPI0007820AED
MGDGVRASKAISVHQNIEDSLDNIAAAGVSLDDLAEGKKEEYENLLNAERDEAYYENIRNFLNDPSSYSNGVPVAYEGDATNARRLADVKDLTLQLGENTATIGSYYQGMIGDLGVKASEAIGMRDNAEGLKAGISYRRDAVSSVSLDEELTLLIQFQHAYNAAARNITLVDEMLDRIINGMGVVGR